MTLVATFGAVTACGDDGPETPAISGESPGEVTIPTLPPTTSAAPGSGDSDAGAEQQDTDTTAPPTTATAGESDSPTTAPSSG